MIYQGVNGLCALDIRNVNLNISSPEKISLLEEQGFTIIPVDLEIMARQQIGAPYRRGALIREAPHTFDCSSLIKWLYGHKGIWLPRNLLLWLELGQDIPVQNLEYGDIVFTSGPINYPVKNISGGIGHVGMVTNRQTVIHTTNRTGVIEIPLDLFIRKKTFRTARRIFSNETITLAIPKEKEVETSDDIAWILYQALEAKLRVR